MVVNVVCYENSFHWRLYRLDIDTETHFMKAFCCQKQIRCDIVWITDKDLYTKSSFPHISIALFLPDCESNHEPATHVFPSPKQKLNKHTKNKSETKQPSTHTLRAMLWLRENRFTNSSYHLTEEQTFATYRRGYQPNKKHHHPPPTNDPTWSSRHLQPAPEKPCRRRLLICEAHKLWFWLSCVDFRGKLFFLLPFCPYTMRSTFKSLHNACIDMTNNMVYMCIYLSSIDTFRRPSHSLAPIGRQMTFAKQTLFISYSTSRRRRRRRRPKQDK